MKILCFIPARGNSKELKNKNIYPFLGKPLISHTINFSKKIKKLTTFVSTDSKKILHIAKKHKVNFNYLRPKKFSGDNSNVIFSVIHALNWLEKRKYFFDAVLLLQPTTPLRSKKELEKIINIFTKENMDSITTVIKMSEHPSECIFIKKKSWSFLKTEKNGTARQNYKNNYFFIDGSIYLAKTKFIKKYKTFVKKGFTEIFKSSQKYPIDINSKKDLKIAEFLNENKLL